MTQDFSHARCSTLATQCLEQVDCGLSARCPYTIRMKDKGLIQTTTRGLPFSLKANRIRHAQSNGF